MALAIDASTPVYVSTGSTSVTNLTTASFTPPAGALLAVMYSNGGAATSPLKPTNTGGTVSWDAAVKVSEVANSCAATIWLGTVTVSASMTVNVTLSGSVNDPDWGFGVAVVTGQAATQNGATNVNTSTSALPSQSVTTVGANSLVLGCVANFSNATVGTAGSNQTLTFNGHAFSFSDATLGAAGWAQYDTRISLAAGSSDTINDSAPTIDYSLAMLEILVATSSGQTPQMLYQSRRVYRRPPFTGPLWLAQQQSFGQVQAGPVSLTRPISDSITLTESLTRNALAFTRAISDSITLADSITTSTVSDPRTLTDSITLAESLTRTAEAFTRTPSDSITLSESLTRTADAFTRTPSDSITLSDALTRGAEAEPRALSDSVTLSESLTRGTEAFPRTISDSITLSESMIAGQSRTISDSVTLSESLARGAMSFTRPVSDSVTLTESLTFFIPSSGAPPTRTLMGVGL